MIHVHVEVAKSIRNVAENSSRSKAYKDFREFKKEKKIAVRYDLDTKSV